jgi:uncharacterized protein YdeI (YjbR/CyaY-like superfamily)
MTDPSAPPRRGPAPPSPADVVAFPSAGDFRAWLEANHDSASELWVGFYKKGVDKTSISYLEAVDEGLCYGWIDGITRRIDDEVYAIRFTPRHKQSTWSAINVARVGELNAAGRMHAAGLRAFGARTSNRTGIYSYENRPRDLPARYRRTLKANADAWSWWQAQTPSYRRTATWWIISARQEATRERRLAALVEDSAAGRPIKPFRYGQPADEAG